MRLMSRGRKASLLLFLLAVFIVVSVSVAFRKTTHRSFREGMVKTVIETSEERLVLSDNHGIMGLSSQNAKAVISCVLFAAAAFVGLALVNGRGDKGSGGKGSGGKKVIRKKRLKADSTEFNLVPVEGSPRLNGRRLKIFSQLTINSLIGNRLISEIFRRAKFDYFRTVHLPEEPTYFPNPRTFEGPKATPKDPHQIDLETYISGAIARTSTDFSYFSISDFYNAYRKESTTPEKVADWVIEKVNESKIRQPPLSAVTQMDESSVRKMAQESTKRFGAGKPLSFLDGIPVLIKEELNCVPYQTRCGTTFLGEERVEEDCTIAAKLREAGAIIIGLTNMHELGMSVFGYNIHPCHGMPRNPYNPDHYTGGSSSGSAAAVAAGLVPVAIGTDGGGSVRIPSALCGAVGLKPTFGRVSFGGNEVSCHSVVHAGPICTNVLDTALVYAMLAGPDPRDPFTINQPRISLLEYDRQNLKGLKIGIDWAFLQDASPEVQKACEKTISDLATLYGAEVKGICIPELQELRIAHTMVIYTEMRENFGEHIEGNLNKLNPENQTVMKLAEDVTARDYIGANKQRTRAMHFFEEIFNEVDVIITPACGQIAPKIEPGDETYGCNDLSTSLQIAKYMLFGNLTGLPGLVVPIAYHDGLPIGLQICAKWWQEDLVLAVGKYVEKTLPKKEEPQIFFKNETLVA